MGAVGPTHVVEILNGRYAVYRKSDGVRVQTSTLNQFWTGAGQTPTGSSFDPRILYDAASQRWFAASVDNARAANNFLVAVSKTSDPTAGWDAFKVDSDATNANWADFPTLGIDASGVTVSATMFPIGSSTLPSATDVLVLPKADLLAGTPTIAQHTLFENAQVGFQAQPVVNLDGGGLPEKLYSGTIAPLGLVFVNTLTGPVTAPTLSAPVTTPVPGIATPPTADQPGAKPNLDAGDSRFGSNVVLQGGSLWAVHSVDVGGRAAVRWLRFDPGTNILLESGLIDDPSLAFSYPSIAVSDFGEIVIGMSGSSATQKRLQNLNPLLLTRRKLPDSSLRIDRQTVLCAQCSNATLERTGRTEETGRHSQRNVFRDRVAAHQQRMLRDQPNPQLNGILRRVDLCTLAINRDRTGIGAVNAIQDAHQRTFARAVFAQKRMNLSRQNRQIHVLVRHHAGKGFGDTLERHQRRNDF